MWARHGTLAGCQRELREALSDWIALRLKLGLEIPELARMNLNRIGTTARAWVDASLTQKTHPAAAVREDRCCTIEEFRSGFCRPRPARLTESDAEQAETRHWIDAGTHGLTDSRTQGLKDEGSLSP